MQPNYGLIYCQKHHSYRMTSEFFKNYKHKIISSEKALDIYPLNTRKKKIIMCHGVFDVVHPGHVRHLAFAKTKADVLIVSITSDQHINKGHYRPHIPQNLRALNLAAFEMVDHVIIDDNKTPIKLLKKIKPEFFAKGFEYTSGNMPPATAEENSVILSYGGEMIFTPGDIVYSSSQFIEGHLPQVQMAKLANIMDLYKININDLKNAIKNLDNLRIHVVGDTIVDTYTRTTLIGGQTKTPTMSVRYDSKENYVGGAGIVAKHLKAIGAKVTFSTILGDDKFKEFVTNDLEDMGIKVISIIDKTRPTTNKNAIIANDYRLLKIDTVDNRPISENVREELLYHIKNIDCDILIFSDFRHGIFNKNTIPKFLDAIKPEIFTAADSQVATRWGNITEFKNFNLVTPNEREARFSLADQDSTVGSLAGQIQKETNCENLILKLGERGTFSISKPLKNKKNHYFSIDSFANDVVDPVGAGDALLAYASATLFKTNSLPIASIIGSIAAACECAIDGNNPIQLPQIKDKIKEIERLLNYNS